MPSGCGNGTGDAVLLFEDAIVTEVRPRLLCRIRLVLSVRGSTCQPRAVDCWLDWQWARCLGGILAFGGIIT
jgi:hypothetical protein